MKNIKKYIIGIAASICLTQCDVLDVDPTGWYSENVAYSSLENVDLYVKGLYSVLYDNATINIDSYCLMDDGATDLLKYSWYGVNGGAMNKFLSDELCHRNEQLPLQLEWYVYPYPSTQRIFL